MARRRAVAVPDLPEQVVADPDAFRAQYDDLLSKTGMNDAATLAHGFGIDTRDDAFWVSSLDVIRESIAEYEGMAG